MFFLLLNLSKLFATHDHEASTFVLLIFCLVRTELLENQPKGKNIYLLESLISSREFIQHLIVFLGGMKSFIN